MERITFQTCLDPAIQILDTLPAKIPFDFDVITSIRTMIFQLKFFKMFLWGLAYWEEPKFEYHWHFRSAFNVLVPGLSKAAQQLVVDIEHVASKGQEINWEEISYDLREKIDEQFQPQAKELCIVSLNGSFKCKPCQHNHLQSFFEYARDTAFFIDFVFQNLEALLHPIDIVLADPVRQQVALIQRKLVEFGNFANPANRLVTRVKNIDELISLARTWVNQISSLTFLCSSDGMNASLAPSLEILFSDLMHRTMRYTPGLVALYAEPTVIPKLVACYIDFLLEDLVEPVVVEIETLREGVIFLLSLFEHPPVGFNLVQVYAIINELPSLIKFYLSEKVVEEICKDKFSGFLQKIYRIYGEVNYLYNVRIKFLLSEFSPPKINAVRFLDSLLETLKKMLDSQVNFMPFAKRRVNIVLQELASFRPFLMNNIELDHEHGDLEELRSQIVAIVYTAEYVTSMCSGHVFPVWYCIVGFPNLIEDIRSIKSKMKMIEDQHALNNDQMAKAPESGIALSQQPENSKLEGAFVGFQEDIRSIIDHLIRGRKDLTIISISGMPGQGKTTLAQRIYNHPSVHHYFSKKVWIYVSKGCTMRELLVKISSNVIEKDQEAIHKLEDFDLVEQVWKRLRMVRYLIVMDDIWDSELWHQVRMSFPNDETGSRILFTSRNHDLASQTHVNSIPYPLRLLSDEESWQLMKEKIFHTDDCPPELLEIGKLIAVCCKGLPLAVSLIAAVLMKTEQKLDLWSNLAETLKSHLATEGCGDIIELSYKNLPVHLRPCFLYFGAFPRGENIRAGKLKLLWIGEGFIEDNEMHSPEDLANGYLKHLVAQSLVVVTERGSTGGIKKCNVHDLLYDLCLEKAVEENFLHWAEERDVVDRCDSVPQKFNHHRLCIGKTDPLIQPRPILTSKELPTSRVHSLLWFKHLDKHSFASLHSYFPCFLGSFKVLKKLDLEAVLLGEFGHREINIITSNIHLRYLALNLSGMIGLPPSIANLWNLEILIVHSESMNPVPVAIWKMKSLRHVKVKYFHFQLEDFQEDDSFEAENIETLGCIYLSYHSTTEEFLMKLPRVKKLICNIAEDELHPMWFSMLRSLQQLESLYIGGAYRKFSTISFPEMENLKKLALSGGQLPWNILSNIWKKLPNLEVLKLLSYSCSGATWDLEDGDFPKLRYLKLEFLDVEKIEFSACGDEVFPCLEELVINSCHKLEEIPSEFGELTTLNSIKVLGICSSTAKRSGLRILEEQQQEYGNYSLQVIVEHYDEEFV